MAEALAAGDRCGADELADELVADAESATLPADYQARLLAAARSLATKIACPPQPPVKGDEDDGNGKDKGKGKGKKDRD